MKNPRLTISVIILGAMFLSMSILVFVSKALEEDVMNPYDSRKLSTNDIIATYHNNMNEAFNRYIKLMMTNLQSNPDDPNGKAFHEDGTPFTVEECYNDQNNYSTFCVAANLLGGYSAACGLAKEGTIALTEDMQAFCDLGADAQAYKGYFNFVAALKNKQQEVFETEQEKADWEKKGLQYLDSITAVRKIVSRDTIIKDELSTAKKTLDQTLSAYDQLRVAWPIHLKYVDVYANLEKYRDKIVEIRHSTDSYPSKFIDLTTTSCT